MRPDDPDNQVHEPWLTKQQLAEHLAVSDRWIEMQQHVGLPYLRMGGLNRYRASEVEAWLREHYDPSTKSS
jgi:predicted DNA-binding transcriptional regulator AlpA